MYNNIYWHLQSQFILFDVFATKMASPFFIIVNWKIKINQNMLAERYL